MFSQYRSTTGTGSLVGDLLAYLIMIGGGVAFVLWMTSVSDVERQTLVDRTLSVATFVLAQPGVFLAAKVSANAKLPPARRVFWTIVVFVVLACAVPATVSYWAHAALQ